MSNVVSLRAERSEAGMPPPYIEEADLVQLHSRIMGMQAKAKVEIFRSILLLDTAAQHARQIVTRTDDPASKNGLCVQVSIIEQLLRTAREMALKL